MIKINNIKLPTGFSQQQLRDAVAKEIGTKTEIKEIKVLKQSYDCRKKPTIFNVLNVAVETDKKISNFDEYVLPLTDISEIVKGITVNKNQRIAIIGSGPAGLFCALTLAKLGLKPIIVERGECVDDRKKTIDSFWTGGKLNKNSNVQFGEGGAGTFSDGKLNTGVNSQLIPYILQEFVNCGADKDILYLAKPHIGTDVLQKVVINLRNKIIELGGEFRFNALVNDLDISFNQIKSVKVNDSYDLECDKLVVACGHSARDTYYMLYEKGLQMIAKPFSVGVRIEHLREMIDYSQYGKNDKNLPSADYKLSCRLNNNRTCYTFCMCPGGIVTGASSEENSVVVNGMSNKSRSEKNSNSALLVSVDPKDFGDSPLKGIEFQRELERKAFIVAKDYRAPYQTVGGFVNNNLGNSYTDVVPSCKPGTVLTELKDILPSFVTQGIREALPIFNRYIKGFDSHSSILTGVETRSSAPLRILRDENHCSNINGIYLCGEGSGYAGGIMSSAVDGIKTALAMMKNT